MPRPKRKQRRPWTRDEDVKLRLLIKEHTRERGDGLTWEDRVRASLPDRSGQEATQRWTITLDPGVRKGPWTEAEDRRLTGLVHRLGSTQWTAIARGMGNGRIAKQCRERWMGCLRTGRPKHRPWTPEEDARLLRACRDHSLKGRSGKGRIPPSLWQDLALDFGERAPKALRCRYEALRTPGRRVPLFLPKPAPSMSMGALLCEPESMPVVDLPGQEEAQGEEDKAEEERIVDTGWSTSSSDWAMIGVDADAPADAWDFDWLSGHDELVV